MNRNIIDDLVLTIINDGNGKLCGVDYESRKCISEHWPIGNFILACDIYNKRRIASGSTSASGHEIDAAAQELLDYYIEHNKECEDDNIQCTHNRMVANGDANFAWKCADCDYIHGKELA